MAVIVRLLLNEELTLANDFFNEMYNTCRSLDAFNWEFLNGPCGASIYVAAIDNDFKNEVKIVGIQCAIPLMMITSSGEKILTAKSEDTLVNLNYRGQDIFNKMYDLLFEECKKVGIKYIWGFTPAYKPFKKLGFDLSFKAHQGLFVLKSIGAFYFLKSLNPNNRTVDKLKILTLTIISKLNTIKYLFGVKPAFKLSISNEFYSKVNLFDKFYSGSNSNIFLHEDELYFKWRILDNKYQNNYQNLDFTDDSGVIVSNIIINRRNSIGYIEQMMFSRNLSSKERISIVKQALRQLKMQKVDAIRFLAFETNNFNYKEVEILKKVGFVIIKRGAWFVWKSIDKNYLQPSESVVLSRLYTQGNN